MHRDLAALGRNTFDLLIIGGGILGAGVARDAALRGWKVALVEKGDFASGTTAQSTRLIHGGLRYLELLDFGLVMEALRERQLLLRLAPHRVRPLPFLVPIYQGQRWGPVRLSAGLTLYDLFAFGLAGRTAEALGLARHRFLPARQALWLEPDLRPDGLRGAMLYYDAQVAFPERLVFDQLHEAAAHGARLANYARAVGLHREGGRVAGAVVEDGCRSAGQVDIRARCTLNATGAWADEVIGLAQPDAVPRVRRTKGVHLVTPQFTNQAVLLLAPQDGRVFFVVPWHGYSLIGTTDTDLQGSPDDVTPTTEEAAYLLQAVRQAFPARAFSSIHYGFAGVRALLRQEGIRESSVSRRHQLINHSEEGMTDFFSLIGGKITSYRHIAEEVVNVLSAWLGGRQAGDFLVAPSWHRNRFHPTSERPLIRDWPGLQTQARDLVTRHRIPVQPEQTDYLVETYGRRSLLVLQMAAANPDLCRPIASDHPAIWAELLYGLKHEMVRTSADFLLRRTSLGFTPDRARSSVQAIAAFLGRRLAWSSEQMRADVEGYYRTLDRMAVLLPEEASSHARMEG